MDYLGFIIRKGKLIMDPYKLKAIKEWQAPISKKEVRQFLGFAGFYREFIQNYAQITKPLTILTHKD